ncbi:MAG: FkbM family methyltransferase [Actinobacteria bacterium]|nr:MAG: FkbM family methyltransferase [Actinomycetota bacterium]
MTSRRATWARNNVLRVRGRTLTLIRAGTGWDPVTRRRMAGAADWVRLGSASCGWLVPADWEVEAPVCVCVGAGEDISFDVALADTRGAQVFILDPTPRAVAHVAAALSGRDDIAFRPWAVWSEDTEVELYEPANPSHVSHSIVNLQSTARSFVAPARTIATVMSEFSLNHVDLLKLDIEGAEYAVIQAVLDSKADVGIINVEFDEITVPSRGAWTRIRSCVDQLARAGFNLAAIDSVSNYTFVQTDYASTAVRSAHAS